MPTITTRRTARIPTRRQEAARPPRARPRAQIVTAARVREARARVALALAVAHAEAGYRLAAHELEQLDVRLEVARVRLRRAGYLG
jgi:hypothetical protein